MTRSDSAGLTGEALSQSLRDYRSMIREVARTNPFLDLPEGERIVEVMLTLMARWNEFTSQQQEAIRATVSYVVTADDEEHDLRSPIGFVDDAERVDDLLAMLGDAVVEG